MQLITSDELPGWYSTQPFVKYGYRNCCSFRDCSLSIFKKHNETINIWLHLPVSIALVPYILYKMPPDPTNFILYLSVFIGNVQILLTSTICHTYFCHSRKVHNICWFADFIGMLTGVLAGGTGFIYYSFKLEIARWVIGSMVLLYPILLWITWSKYKTHTETLPLSPREGFPEFVGPLAGFVAACWIAPLIAAKVTDPAYTHNPELVHAWNLSASCVLILFIGGLFQGSNFPEKFTDKLGHSHQWWHLCSSLLTFVWVEAITTHHLARSRELCL
jgi:predicted membrane channel-forming protein YqfA (hemolysin III family)